MKYAGKLCLILFLLCYVLRAQEQASRSAEEMAMALANPVASLISVPFQNNFDFGLGPDGDGSRYNLNIQPVIPISLNENWNMISRTIVPIISQNDVFYDGSSETGLGDIAQSVFFSPKAPSKGGLVWGVGPVFLLPTATNDRIGADKWAVGPNAIVLKIKGPWTYGALVNHMWDFAGSGDGEINTSFFQPFVAFATPQGASYSLASENSQNWNNDIFGGFFGVYYAKVVNIGKQMMQVGGGPKVYYGNNPFNPDWGLRLNIIALFPK
jgi:hypothetical protein